MTTIRRQALVLYLAVFAAQIGWGSLVPMMPIYAGRYHLGGVAAGLLIAASSLTTLIVSIPAAALSARLGARRTTVAAVALMAVADLGQAFAPGFVALVGARCLFGLAFGVLWTAGLAWAGALAGEGGSRVVTLTVTASGVGSVLGPAAAGVLAARLGTAAPFLCSAAVSLVPLAGMLALAPGPAGAATGRSLPASAVAAAARDRRAHSALVLVLVAGFSSSVANLLVPLELHRNGLGTAAIGAAFATASMAFIAASAGVARLGERGVRIGAGAVVCLAAAGVLVPAAVSTATVPLLAFLVLRAPAGAAMYAIGYPLGVAGGGRRRPSRDAVSALLNLGFAAAALVGPLVAGALMQLSGPRASFSVLLCGTVAAGLWLNRSRTPATA